MFTPITQHSSLLPQQSAPTARSSITSTRSCGRCTTTRSCFRCTTMCHSLATRGRHFKMRTNVSVFDLRLSKSMYIPLEVLGLEWMDEVTRKSSAVIPQGRLPIGRGGTPFVAPAIVAVSILCNTKFPMIPGLTGGSGGDAFASGGLPPGGKGSPQPKTPDDNVVRTTS